MPERRSRWWTPAILAAIAYLALAAALAGPVLSRARTTLFADHGDMRGWIWWVWAKANGHLDGAVNALQAAPFGEPNTATVGHPIPDALVVALARAFDEIAAVNLVVLLSFPLTALTTYVVLERLVRNRAAAFFGGLAFGFCPAAVMQAVGGHASYSMNLFIPVFLLALFANRERRSWLGALGVAAAFAAVAFTAIYMAYFAAFLALMFVVFDYVTGEGPWRRAAVNYALCFAFALLFVVPVELGALIEQLTKPTETLSRIGHVRGFHELDVFAARPWNYVVPSIDHPVFGEIVRGFVSLHLRGSNAFEQTLYLGMTPLALVVAGLAAAARGQLEPSHRRPFLFFCLAAAGMYFMSLPPLVGGAFPTPSYFLYDIAPMFRVYARAGILVGLLVACAAAVVLMHYSARLPARRFNSLAGALTLLLAFEYWTVPPGRGSEVAPPPGVYQWLAQQPGDLIVAEYPMVRWDEAASYAYPFWQRVHGKRLVNGASPGNAPAWALFEEVRNLADPGTPRRLAEAGVKYVIVHPEMYREGPIPEALKRYYPPEQALLAVNGGVVPPLPASLRLCRTFGQDLVFALDAVARPPSQDRPC